MFCTGGPARPPVAVIGGRNFGKDTVGNEEYHQNIPWRKGA